MALGGCARVSRAGSRAEHKSHPGTHLALQIQGHWAPLSPSPCPCSPVPGLSLPPLPEIRGEQPPCSRSCGYQPFWNLASGWEGQRPAAAPTTWPPPPPVPGASDATGQAEGAAVYLTCLWKDR
uniref:Uncharacterized protein n=1 Tax=Molossus molossus TaxID=27622 RepID=A0A7J8E2X0_MOLMO|nr:hypothetical protein HJG59_009041 [Molossus molossus]